MMDAGKAGQLGADTISGSTSFVKILASISINGRDLPDVNELAM